MDSKNKASPDSSRKEEFSAGASRMNKRSVFGGGEDAPAL